jgi:hypothetical protein
MNDLATRLCRTALANPENAEDLLAGFGACDAHLDDQSIAGVLDGAVDPRALGHALRCEACAEKLSALEHLIDLHAFPSGPHRTIQAPSTLLLASIRSNANGELEILECTGATRIQPALAVRSDRALSAVSIRDRAEDALLEIGLIPEPESDRLSLIVRWLRDSANLCTRAYQAGRLIAETNFEEGSALLENLRTSDIRVDVARGETILAVARLNIESA